MNKLKHFIFITLLAMGIQSCSESSTCQISGKLEGLKTNKLLLVFDDPKSRVDSIFLNADKFFYTFSPDTITMMRLVNNNGEYIPLFADKGWEIKLEGSFEHPKVSGKGPNQDYQDFLKIIADKKESEYIHEAIRFAHEHPDSYASAYIIYKYLADTDKPDKDTISKALHPLYGAVKDCRILSTLKENKREKINDERLSYYTFKDRNKKSIHIYNKDFKYTLINIWASWDKKSCDMHDSIYNICQDAKIKDLRIINCSLDYDKKAWVKRCKKDTPNWIETCDFDAWSNSLIEAQQIRKLPANILINRNRDIITRDISSRELIDKVNELIKNQKDK